MNPSREKQLGATARAQTIVSAIAIMKTRFGGNPVIGILKLVVVIGGSGDPSSSLRGPVIGETRVVVGLSLDSILKMLIGGDLHLYAILAMIIDG